MRGTILAFAVTAAVTGPAAEAATIEAHHGVISVTGSIVVGDSARFAELATDPSNLVVLNSPGGEVENALAMAHLIHNAGIPTLIPAGQECLSACAVLFLAGSQRYMGDGARLGVHSAWDADGSNSGAAYELADFITDIAAAPLDMIYAMTMTPPNQMWMLPRARWSELHIKEWKGALN